ncbi:unnamed protein product [Darwinula stevensoni]|uniref:Uncharacterized protein n=1 Tax=Darwinula stevensoni TaxID=69355 RepID=A0A7R8X102_9CRUS|nr:unnamed protein product [Darwinula stevensoni]CAG0879442.1 unnamed protein product [Darwinula stevensoni]
MSGDVTHVKWLQTVLEAHMPYLLSNPSMEHLLEPINRMIEMRFETMKQVSHLTGRVHSLLNHLEIAKDKELQDISHQLPIKYQKDVQCELSVEYFAHVCHDCERWAKMEDHFDCCFGIHFVLQGTLLDLHPTTQHLTGEIRTISLSS